MLNKPFPVSASICAAGGMTALADALGISVPAIAQWKRIPPLRVLQVENITSIPRWVLRPDLYPPPSGAAFEAFVATMPQSWKSAALEGSM